MTIALFPRLLRRLDVVFSRDCPPPHGHPPPFLPRRRSSTRIAPTEFSHAVLLRSCTGRISMVLAQALDGGNSDVPHSAMVNALSTSIPRYRTVLSSFDAREEAGWVGDFQSACNNLKLPVEPPSKDIVVAWVGDVLIVEADFRRRVDRVAVIRLDDLFETGIRSGVMALPGTLPDGPVHADQ